MVSMQAIVSYKPLHRTHYKVCMHLYRTRPDMTIAVDWVLKTNDLSIYCIVQTVVSYRVLHRTHCGIMQAIVSYKLWHRTYDKVCILLYRTDHYIVHTKLVQATVSYRLWVCCSCCCSILFLNIFFKSGIETPDRNGQWCCISKLYCHFLCEQYQRD